LYSGVNNDEGKIVRTVAEGHHPLPSNYLVKDMPRRVLFGKAGAIIAWCRENERAVPTLLDLALARSAANKSGNKRGGRK
jgi:hypothetical protein